MRFEWPRKTRSGLLETTAPAWACSISRRTAYRHIALVLEHRQDKVDSRQRKGFDPELSAAVPSDWLSRLDKAEYAEQYPTRTSHMDYGWPVLSMWCWFREFRFDRTARGPELFGGLQLSDFAATGPRDIRWYRLRALPLRPIWPGFAINTVFYAGVLWLLIPGPFAMRRFIRRRRGLCPACGYPAGESAVCSECGKSCPRNP